MTPPQQGINQLFKTRQYQRVTRADLNAAQRTCHDNLWIQQTSSEYSKITMMPQMCQMEQVVMETAK